MQEVEVERGGGSDSGEGKAAEESGARTEMGGVVE